jgi:hypothetical protein
VKTLVLCAAAWCVTLLAGSVVAALARPRPLVRAAPRAPAWRGVAWLFGRGLSPWAKDGARRHPMVVLAGATYHAGIAAGLLLIVVLVAGLSPGPAWRFGLALALATGAGAGLGLAVRRARCATLRRSSVPDDVVSNGIVTAFLAAGAVAVIAPPFELAFLAVAALLLFYAPLGKIRHCVFYPLARLSLGLTLGRRGVVGAASREAGA